MDSEKVNTCEVFVTYISENTGLSDYNLVMKNSSKKRYFCFKNVKICSSMSIRINIVYKKTNNISTGVCMKKLYTLTISIFVLMIFAGCNNVSNPDSGKIDYVAGMNYLGDVSRIYKATSNARFATGQIIQDYRGHEVRFEGNLVEYNSIKQDILKYVESLEDDNALMHQNYEDVDYDPGKKYVELACYTDTATNKVIAYEVRLFPGNFLEKYETDFWYAKSVTFNSSFTWDIDNYVEVDFGMPLGEEDSVFIPEFKISTEQQSFIDAVGDVGKIYHNLHGISDTTWGEKQAQIESHLVEYKNLKENIKSKFSEENNAKLYRGDYIGFKINKDKIYVEVILYRDKATNEIISYELRLLDNDAYIDRQNNPDGKYAKCCSFSSLDELKQ